MKKILIFNFIILVNSIIFTMEQEPNQNQFAENSAQINSNKKFTGDTNKFEVNSNKKVRNVSNKLQKPESLPYEIKANILLRVICQRIKKCTFAQIMLDLEKWLDKENGEIKDILEHDELFVTKLLEILCRKFFLREVECRFYLAALINNSRSTSSLKTQYSLNSQEFISSFVILLEKLTSWGGDLKSLGAAHCSINVLKNTVNFLKNEVDKKEVFQLLKKNMVLSSANSLLCNAIYRGTELTKLILDLMNEFFPPLEKKLAINKESTGGCSKAPLQIAIYQRNLEIIELLIANGAILHSEYLCDAYGSMIDFRAVKTVKCLLKHGANPHVFSDERQCTPFQEAKKCRQYYINYESTVENYDAIIKLFENANHTRKFEIPKECCKLYLAASANDNQSRLSLKSQFSENPHAFISIFVKWLESLTIGESNLTNLDTENCLINALKNIVNFLKNEVDEEVFQGLKETTMMNSANSMLCKAIYRGTELTKLVLDLMNEFLSSKKKIIINQKTKWCPLFSPLQIAIHQRNLSIIELLVANGAIVHSEYLCDAYGGMIDNKAVETVRCLLKHGANPHVFSDERQCTPFQEAKKWRQYYINYESTVENYDAIIKLFESTNQK